MLLYADIILSAHYRLFFGEAEKQFSNVTFQV